MKSRLRTLERQVENKARAIGSAMLHQILMQIKLALLKICT
jgi:hypothetical protein